MLPPLIKNKNNLSVFLIFSLELLLIFGGLGVEEEYIKYLGILVGVLLLVVVWIQKRKILFPKFIIAYSLFLLLFLINTFVVSVDAKKSLEAFSLFLCGGLFWVALYNFKAELANKFAYLIIFLGVIFGFLTHFYELFDLKKISPWGLYAESSAYYNHNHIGDLWALVLLVVIFYLIRTPKKYIYWLLIPLGVYFLIISQSRSALLSLFVGLYYLAENRGLIGKYKKAFLAAVSILAIIFL